jgi:hypothetical protein
MGRAGIPAGPAGEGMGAAARTGYRNALGRVVPSIGMIPPLEQLNNPDQRAVAISLLISLLGGAPAHQFSAEEARRIIGGR